ncbi:ribonuclease H-like domain-containing protein [Tanacetum coccineum]
MGTPTQCMICLVLWIPICKMRFDGAANLKFILDIVVCRKPMILAQLYVDVLSIIFRPRVSALAGCDTEGTSTTLIPGPITADEKVQKKNDVKARSMLLMTLPNEHLLTFNQYKDAKTLFAAIQIRFGGNDATKKTQKTLLKQMYENFSAPSTESLNSIFNRLQKIVSQLAILGENISQEYLNLKFLRSLPSEWNTHVDVWRNKPDLDIMSFNDLYNNFKIVEQEVKGTSNSSSSSQNIAFVSSPSSTNEVNTAYGVSTDNTQVSHASTIVSTASTQVNTASLSDATIYAFLANQPNGSQLVHEDLEQIHDDDLEEMDLKWQLALLSMRTRRFFQKTGRKITINGSDTAVFDKSKVECFNCHKMGHFARECRGSRSQDNRNRNQDSSKRAVNVEETSSKAILAIDGAGFDWTYMADDEVPTNMALMEFSDSEIHNDKACSKTCLKSFETLKTQLDDLRIEFNKSEFNLATYKRGLAYVEEQLVFYKKNEVMFCEQIVVLKRDISYKYSETSVLKSELEKLKQEKESYQLKIKKIDNASKSLDKLIGSQITDKSRKGVGFAEELVSNDKLEKKTVFQTVSKIEFVRPQQQEKPFRKPFKYAEMYRNMVPRAVLMKTGLRPLNTARPVNTAHPKTTVYSARPMSCFSKSAQSTVKRPYQIRTTLTNKNFSQKVNTAKGKFYTARPKAVNTARPNSAVVNAVRANQGHLQKEDQGYVDSGCSRHMTGNMSYLSDFKEFDGGYVTFGGGAKGGKITSKGTLKTGKLDFEDVYFVKELRFNLFSVSQKCDKKNSVLFTDSGCFVLSSDFKLANESQVLLKLPRKNNMYSVDMKNIVPKESLTCLVAKATLEESMIWHMRLASKDETGDIIKSFITQIENLVDKKVKIIRCDNGTKFKNRVMSEFCEKKGIKREFSVARTPQQNGVAERRNRTLIKNKVLVVKPHNKTPYELFRGRTPALSFMRPFGCHVTILNTLYHLGKFDGKSDDGFFVGYSLNSKVTDNQEKDKIKAKTTNPSTGTERA